MKKSILIISKYQFGYNTAILNYAKYLNDTHNVYIVCYYQNKPIIKLENCKILYLLYKNKFKSLIHLISFCNKLKKIINNEVTIVHYFLLSSLLNLVLHKTIVFINTSFIFPNNPFKEWIYNRILKFETFFFSTRTIISDSLAKYLRIINFNVLPLGGDPTFISNQKKIIFTNNINLIYVGTLFDREIEKTIHGIYLSILKFKEYNFIYNIIGFGSQAEVEKIKKSIIFYGIEKNVNFLGEIRKPLLNTFLLNSDIAVSFIPCILRYQNQPPTKTFEYLLSGIPVLATNTNENIKIIDKYNGILIDDNATSFLNGIEFYLKNRTLYNSEYIYFNSLQYSWLNIVKNKLLPIINNMNRI